MPPKRKAQSRTAGAADPTAILRSGRNRPNKGLVTALPPINSIPNMFQDMLAKALNIDGRFAAGEPLVLNVATVCSGTEAPLTAMNLIREAGRNIGIDVLFYQHQFSCEIEPFKQAFIRRNHDPPLIFRDVVELGAEGAKTAMDASGYPKDIPSDKLDLLIAGTSCVDFSTLNTQKDQKTKVNAFAIFSAEARAGDKAKNPLKLDPVFQEAVKKQLTEGLESIGESMTTFLSTLSFIMDKRPRILIFENVQTAPWKPMANFWLRRAGYAAQWAKLDSKDFYLPQDRIRGYLVAVDAAVFDHPEQLAHKALCDALGLVRYASSSVAEFLLDDDDRHLLQARDEIARYGSHGKQGEGQRLRSGPVDWSHSQIRHWIYGQQWNLECQRRFSKASYSHGAVLSIAPPARSWIEYWAHETPRVIDLFDNLFEQLSKRTGCDMLFKCAIFNISQNLDRIPVSIGKFGLAPIITPSGMPTITNLGRPLLGVECLTLQGIPKNHLRLAGETHRELRDLAGNAMTVTVVGAVILGTLMAAGPALAMIHKATRSDLRADSLGGPADTAVLDYQTQELPDWDLGHFTVDPRSILEHGRFKVCHCPVVGSHTRDVFRCRDCGQLACQQCKGNPPHNWQRYRGDDRKMDIADLKVQIQQGLPGIFNMRMRKNSMQFFETMGDRAVSQAYRDAVRDLLTDNDYYLRDIRVSNSLTVEYRSEHSIARLTMTKTGGVHWFILPIQNLDSPREFGEVQKYTTPVAKGSLGNKSTVNPEVARWYVWEPVGHVWKADVCSKTEHSFILMHTAIRRLVPMHRDVPRPPDHLEKHIQDMIRGTWWAKPRCGTPDDSLYIRDGHPDKKKAFLLRDVDPIGHPKKDRFIFSEDLDSSEARQFQGGEVYTVLHRVSDMGEWLRLSVPGYWQPLPSSASFGTPFEISVHEPGPADVISCASNSSFAGSQVDDCCAVPAHWTLLSFQVDLAGLPLSPATRDCWSNISSQNGAGWYCVPATQLEDFFKSLSFMTNGLEKGHFFKPDNGLSFDPNLGVPVKFCQECCVEPPTVHWVKATEGKKMVVPWEDPDEVQPYDAKMKARSTPFSAMVRLERGDDGSRCRLSVKLGVNSRTLASRAAANLAYTSRPRNSAGLILDNIETSYQVEVGCLLGSNVRFGRFFDAVPTTQDSTGIAQVISEANLPIPSFERKGLRLREDQIRSVNWMLAREKAPAPFPETESEELVFEAFNLRIVGRATFPNDGYAFCCRGGVVAHGIGYGKTVVMIALLELQRKFDGKESVNYRTTAALRLWESPQSFIHLKATLVIVPDHITTQWLNEFHKFGSTNIRIVVIRRYQDLVKTRLSVLEKADVIIVAMSIFKASYTQNVDSLTVDRPGGGRSDRENGDRYRSSVETIRKVVSYYRGLDEGLAEAKKGRLADQKTKQLVRDANEHQQVLSKKWVWAGSRKNANKNQQTGKGRGRAGKAGEAEGKKKEEAKKQTKTVKPLWTATTFLENFSFARVIADEFSYDKPEVTLFFTHTLANAKWLLSGTPRLDNLADVVHIGRLLSIHVAGPDLSIPSYLDSITVGPKLHPTAPSEEYRLRCAPLRSHNFVMDRHRNAEAFIGHFVRKDDADTKRFERQSKKVELELPILARIAYGGMEQEVALAKGNFFNLPMDLRKHLGSTLFGTTDGDDADAGPELADDLLALFAARHVTDRTLLMLDRWAADMLTELAGDLKTGIDKLFWLSNRINEFVDKDIRAKFPRYEIMLTMVRDIMDDLADAREGWNKATQARFGGMDALSRLCRTICPSTALRYHSGGIEDWMVWRYTEAKTFWPDWYDLPQEYIESLAAPERRLELLELATDACLLSICHPNKQKIPLSGDGHWLDAHARSIGQIMMDTRRKTDFVDMRRASAAQQARAGAVREIVPRFTSNRLVKFLKDVMAEKLKSFNWKNQEYIRVVSQEDKKSLQDKCIDYKLRFNEKTSASELLRKLVKRREGLCVPADYTGRGRICPRTPFPIPNRIVEKRGGRTEELLEELTVTYSYVQSCFKDWHAAFRRVRFYRFMDYVARCKPVGRVDRWCPGCMRKRLCVGDNPAYIVVACGHWICEEHKAMIDNAGEDDKYCPVISCGTACGLPMEPTIRVTQRDVLDCPDIWEQALNDHDVELTGGKIPGIVSLVKDTPKDDKVILFSYLDSVSNQVKKQLIQDGVPVLSMIEDPMATQVDPLDVILEKFKNGQAKVLIMDALAEHAAGSNLTIANHIIFASPLPTRDLFLRKMYYKQAIGRCLREGQTKKVTVTSFVTKGTIDEAFYRPEDVDEGLDQLAEEAGEGQPSDYVDLDGVFEDTLGLEDGPAESAEE